MFEVFNLDHGLGAVDGVIDAVLDSGHDCLLKFQGVDWRVILVRSVNLLANFLGYFVTHFLL